MPFRITINIFSGRRDPLLELSGKEAKDAWLRPARPLSKSEALIPLESKLGYRGLLVEQLGAPARGLPKFFSVFDGRLQGQSLSHRAADEGFEDFIAARAGRSKVGMDFSDYLRREMTRARRDLLGVLHWKHPHHPHSPAVALHPTNLFAGTSGGPARSSKHDKIPTRSGLSTYDPLLPRGTLSGVN